MYLMWLALRLMLARAWRNSWRWLAGAFLGVSLLFAVRAVQHAKHAHEAPKPKPSVSRAKAEIANALRPGVQRYAERDRVEAAAALYRAQRAHEAAIAKHDELSRADDDKIVKAWREYHERRNPRPAKSSRTGLRSIAFLCLLLTASSARADDSCLNSSGNEPCKVAHVVTGEDGLWLPEATYRAAIADLSSLEQCRAESAELSVSGAASMRRADTLDRQLLISSEAIRELARGVDRQRMRAEKAERRLSAWFRRPWVFLMTGALVGGFVGWRVAR